MATAFRTGYTVKGGAKKGQTKSKARARCKRMENMGLRCHVVCGK